MLSDQAATSKRLAGAARAERRRRPLKPGSVLMHAGLMLGVFVFMFPFYWMIISSLKPLPDLYKLPITLWPEHGSLQNYLEVLGLVPSPTIQGRGDVNMARALLNSTIIASIYTVGSVFLSSLAGYAFAKMRFKARNFLFTFMLATMMIPGSVGLIPNYMIMAKLGWINTWLPLIIPGLATPFSVFWMRQYITSVPDEMVEAAQIDGCGPFGIYWRVIVPVIAPGLAALTIFNFMANWNSFMAPLIYLNNAKLYPVPLFLGLLNTSINAQPTPYTLTFAAALISLLPILAVFLGAQRYFIAGLTAGSLK